MQSRLAGQIGARTGRRGKHRVLFDGNFAARNCGEVFRQLSHVSFGDFRRVSGERSGVARVVPQLLNSIIEHEQYLL